MKKIDLGQMIQILANLGVIAGIVFLGYELRQNNESLESQVGSTRQVVRVNDFLLPLEYPDLGRALVKAANHEVLSDYEELIVNRAVSAILLNWQFVHAEVTRGRIEESSIPIEIYRDMFHGRMNNSARGYWPALSDYWETNKDSFDPDFVRWFDENVINANE